MDAIDAFSVANAEFMQDRYDCVDRIILNAYFQMGCSPGGFRTWWRALYGTDEDLDNNHLMRLAGRFARRVRGWAKSENIPLIDCAAGERKHDLAVQYLPKDGSKTGIFLVLVNRAPFPVWDVRRYGQGGIDLRRKKPAPYVNHYTFHIWDEQWGHVAIRICGHPPFSALVMLNGHEYVTSGCQQQEIQFRKEGNCFTELADAPGLQHVADTLRSQDATGRLRQVCERWLYRCLCFALDSANLHSALFLPWMGTRGPLSSGWLNRIHDDIVRAVTKRVQKHGSNWPPETTRTGGQIRVGPGIEEAGAGTQAVVNEPCSESGKPDRSTINFSEWGIGYDPSTGWHVFRMTGKKWQYLRKKLRVSRGIIRYMLESLLREKGILTKKELFNYFGGAPPKSVKPSLTRLRKIISSGIGVSGKNINVLPKDRETGSWRLEIRIGQAEKIDPVCISSSDPELTFLPCE